MKNNSTRRSFLRVGGILLGGSLATFYFGCNAIRRTIAHKNEAAELGSGIKKNKFQYDFWIEILSDNTVVIKSPKVEMGQGIFTGYALMVAEELEMPLAQIKVVHALSSNENTDGNGTGGSSSTSSLYEPLRMVAATLRETLKLAVSKHWKVALNEVSVKDGFVQSGDKKMTYAEVMKTVDNWELADEPKLKVRTEFKHIGKSVGRVDLRPKVMGKTVYGIDSTMPDMLYATILQSPYIGGSLESANTDKAKAFAGVIKVFELNGEIVVVAKNRYAAEMAKRKIDVVWTVPKRWNQQDIEQQISVGNGKNVVLESLGNCAKIFKKSAAIERLQATYKTPMAAHAHLEPNGSVAHYTPEKVTIIMGTQAAKRMLGRVAKALDMKEEQIEIKTAFLGGGFGRRYLDSNAPKAALISKEMGKPIHLFFDRTEEFRNGYCRPPTQHKLEAKINADGTIEAMEHQLATGDMILSGLSGFVRGILGVDITCAAHGALIQYNLKNTKTEVWQNTLPFKTGIWRGVGMFANIFAIESFIDELAHKAGIDPIELRLKHLTSEDVRIQRIKKAVEAAAEKSGWKDAKPEGVGRGFACASDRNTPAAIVIEVMLENGKIRVTKATTVLDPGLVVNPEGVITQMEGCVMMGISAALYEGLYVEDGQFTATNYHQYPMASLRDTPKIQSVLLENWDHPSGVGEPPIAPMAAAIANAVFDLTGKRLRSLPLQTALKNYDNE